MCGRQHPPFLLHAESCTSTALAPTFARVFVSITSFVCFFLHSPTYIRRLQVKLPSCIPHHQKNKHQANNLKESLRTAGSNKHALDVPAGAVRITNTLGSRAPSFWSAGVKCPSYAWV